MPAEPLDNRLELRVLARARYLHDYVRNKIPAVHRSLLAPEDILQEVWISAFKSFAAFQDDRPEAFDSWLTALAKRKFLDAARGLRALKRGGGLKRADGNGANSSFSQLINTIAGNQPTPSSQEATQEAVFAVRIALASLPDAYREALTRYHLDGKSRSEIAAEMNKSESAVNSLLHRGLKLLRERMGPSGHYLSGSSNGGGGDPDA